MPTQRDDSLSEQDVAGPPVASTASALNLLGRYWRKLQERRRRQRLRVTLHSLTERELMDIGVTRAEIEFISARRSIDRLRNETTRFWMISRM